MDYSKKSKEELIKEITLLKAKEQNVELVLNKINEMFYRISFDKEKKVSIDYISPKIEKVLGITNKEYLKNHNILYNYFHPDDIENIKSNVSKLKETKNPMTFTYRFFNNLLQKYVWLEETLVNTYSAKGERNGFFGSIRDISEKIENQQHLEFILSNIGECIYNVKFTENEKKLTYVGPQIKELSGLSIEEFIEEGSTGKIYSRIHPEDIDRINKSVEKGLYIEKRSIINHSFRFKPKGTNKYIWIDETIHSKFDKKGSLSETTTVLKDITEKRLFEESLKKSEQEYKNLFNSSPNFVYIQDKNGTFLDVNQTVLDVFGYKKEDIIGKTPALFDNPYKIKNPDFKLLIDKVWKGKTQQFSWWGKDKNGEDLLEELTLKRIKYFNNDVIIAVGQDVTEKFKANTLLKESEEKYKKLIENSPFGIVIHDDGKLLFSNQKAKDILGFDSAQHKIDIKDINEFLLPEYRAEGLKRRKKLHQGEETEFVNARIKSPFSGKIIDIQTKAVPTIFQNTKAIQIVFQDISSQKELTKERLKNQIAEESNSLMQKEIQRRKKIERQLINNQNYTSNIISSSLDIICSSDDKGNIKEFNRAAENSFGYSRKEMENLKSTILFANQAEIDKVNKSLNTKGNFKGEVLNRRKNGETFTSFLAASVLYNNEGKIIGTMGVSRDITDIKLAELELRESEERYRDLFENASDLIQSIGIDGKIIYVNKSWKQTLGYEDNDLQDKNIFDFIHPDGKEHCVKFLTELTKTKTKQPANITIELLHKNGNKVLVEGSVSSKADISGKIVSTRGIFRDVTEETWFKTRQGVYNRVAKIISEKTNPMEMYESIRKELGAVMNTDVFGISYAINSNTIAFPYYYDLTRGGLRQIADRTNKKGLNEYFIKTKKSKILNEKELKKLYSDGKCELIGPVSKQFVGAILKVKNNVVGVLSVQSYDNENAFDEKSLEILEFISGALALAIQKKFDEKVLFEQASKLKSIIDNSSHSFWTYDRNLGLTSFNQSYSDAVYDLYGSRPVIEQNKKSRVNNPKLQPFWDKKYNEAFEGKAIEFITQRINKKGNLVVREVFLTPIFDENGEVTLVSGIAHDITDKFNAEEAIKNSLKEKEVLLKEVHHRVKNNLQVISSILNLQTTYIDDQNIVNILRESQDRIKTMSIIHESLYQTNDFSKINFSQYVVSLSKNLVHSYSKSDTFVDTKYKIDDVNLSLDLSIPCGLIVNELVSNVIKHAFRGRKKGCLKIELSRKKGIIVLKVSDDGIGMPKNIKIEEVNSLGLQLVTALVDQIDGKMKIVVNKGTAIEITFKQIQ